MKRAPWGSPERDHPPYTSQTQRRLFFVNQKATLPLLVTKLPNSSCQKQSGWRSTEGGKLCCFNRNDLVPGVLIKLGSY